MGVKFFVQLLVKTRHRSLLNISKKILCSVQWLLIQLKGTLVGSW